MEQTGAGRSAVSHAAGGRTVCVVTGGEDINTSSQKTGRRLRSSRPESKTTTFRWTPCRFSRFLQDGLGACGNSRSFLLVSASIAVCGRVSKQITERKPTYRRSPQRGKKAPPTVCEVQHRSRAEKFPSDPPIQIPC